MMGCFFLICADACCIFLAPGAFGEYWYWLHGRLVGGVGLVPLSPSHFLSLFSGFFVCEHGLRLDPLYIYSSRQHISQTQRQLRQFVTVSWMFVRYYGVVEWKDEGEMFESNLMLKLR